MGNTFNQADAKQARLWYERRLYTYGPVALPTGPSTVFTAANWTPQAAPEWQAELTGVWATANAGVQLQWIYDNDAAGQGGAQGYTDAAPAGVRRMGVSAPAVKQLQMTALNTSGAQIAGFQLNYEVTMRRLSVADKLVLGYNLSAQDEKILNLLGPDGRRQVADLVERGTSPIDLDTQLQRTVRNRRLRDHASSGLYHATAASNTTFATMMAAAGEFLVLEEIAVEGAAGLANPLTVYVDRDDDENFEQFTGNAFAQTNESPWRVWVPALRNLTFRASSSGGVMNNVAIRIRVGRYSMSNLLRARFGLVHGAEDLPGDTYAKVLAGIS